MIRTQGKDEGRISRERKTYFCGEFEGKYFGVYDPHSEPLTYDLFNINIYESQLTLITLEPEGEIQGPIEERHKMLKGKKDLLEMGNLTQVLTINKATHGPEGVYKLDVKELVFEEASTKHNYTEGEESFGMITGRVYGYLLDWVVTYIQDAKTGLVEIKTENGIESIRWERYNSDGTKYWGEWEKVPVQEVAVASQTVERVGGEGGSGAGEDFSGTYSASKYSGLVAKLGTEWFLILIGTFFLFGFLMFIGAGISFLIWVGVAIALWIIFVKVPYFQTARASGLKTGLIIFLILGFVGFYFTKGLINSNKKRDIFSNNSRKYSRNSHSSSRRNIREYRKPVLVSNMLYKGRDGYYHRVMNVAGDKKREGNYDFRFSPEKINQVRRFRSQFVTSSSWAFLINPN